MEQLILTTHDELENLIENSVRKALNSRPESPTPPGDELLTIEQAADFLSLTKPTLYAYVSKGLIPSMKRSKRLYFSREDLMNYIKQGRRETNEEITAGADGYLTTKRGGTQ